jgi:hypothetical protein
LNNQIVLSNGLVWHYASAESRVDGGIFFWQDLLAPDHYPCAKDDYLQFNSGYGYLWSINGTACSYGWKVSDETGTYKFTANGKNLLLSHSGAIDTLAINKFTLGPDGKPDSLVVTSRAAYQARTSLKYHCYPAKP